MRLTTGRRPRWSLWTRSAFVVTLPSGEPSDSSRARSSVTTSFSTRVGEAGEWPALPAHWSFSTLREVESCPLRYALRSRDLLGGSPWRSGRLSGQDKRGSTPRHRDARCGRTGGESAPWRARCLGPVSGRQRTARVGRLPAIIERCVLSVERGAVVQSSDERSRFSAGCEPASTRARDPEHRATDRRPAAAIRGEHRASVASGDSTAPWPRAASTWPASRSAASIRRQAVQGTGRPSNCQRERRRDRRLQVRSTGRSPRGAGHALWRAVDDRPHRESQWIARRQDDGGLLRQRSGGSASRSLERDRNGSAATDRGCG